MSTTKDAIFLLHVSRKPSPKCARLEPIDKITMPTKWLHKIQYFSSETIISRRSSSDKLQTTNISTSGTVQIVAKCARLEPKGEFYRKQQLKGLMYSPVRNMSLTFAYTSISIVDYKWRHISTSGVPVPWKSSLDVHGLIQVSRSCYFCRWIGLS